MTSICLSMIVKNEAHCITKCLDSVKQFINYWVICDTGSTDGTQEIVRDYLKNIPGKLYQHEWESFDVNRNLALNLSYDKSDYILWIDADDTLSVDNSHVFDRLSKPFYSLEIKHNSITYNRPHLIRNDTKCNWVGILHEYLASPPGVSPTLLNGAHINFGGIGSRSRDPNKYINDALVFEKALAKDPNNSRHIFYCAQSYRDAGAIDLKYLHKAIEYYEKRIGMGGWEEEQFISAFEIGKMLETIHPENNSLIENIYLSAHNFCPHRSEALCYLSAYCRKNHQYNKAYFYSKVASNISKPKDSLFIELDCYDWKVMDELAIAAFYVGKKQEALFLNKALLSSGKLPESEVTRVKTNLQFCL